MSDAAQNKKAIPWSKLLFWVISAAAFVAILWKSEDIGETVQTVQSGTLIPLVFALVFQFCKYLGQVFAYSRAYAAVGVQTRPVALFPLVFASVFLNTFTGGAAMAALAIDDCRRRGASVPKSTSAMLLTQTAFYAGFVFIMVVVFIIMQAAGYLQVWEFLCGMVMVVIVTAFSTALILGGKSPVLLTKILTLAQRVANWFMGKIHKPGLPSDWAQTNATQFTDGAASIKENPQRAAASIAYMTLSYIADMLCFIAVGFAFGVTTIDALVAGYVFSVIFINVSPTPQGIGFVEAGCAVVLAMYGVPGTIAAAIMLVYRCYCFWLPFLMGALLLRRTGTFQEKDKSQESKKDNQARILALVIGAFGIINILVAVMPVSLSGLEFITSWLAIGSALTPTAVVFTSIILILLMRGLVQRNRTSWALALFDLIIMGIFLVYNGQDFKLLAPLFVLVIWLFAKRDIFTNINLKSRSNIFAITVPILIAIVIVLVYGVIGFYTLDAEFGATYTLVDALRETLRTITPGFDPPQAIVEHGEWFVHSLKTVSVVVAIWAVIEAIYPFVIQALAPKRPTLEDKDFAEMTFLETIRSGAHDAELLSEDYISRFANDQAEEQTDEDAKRFC